LVIDSPSTKQSAACIAVASLRPTHGLEEGKDAQNPGSWC
jgi:hypothetical protein